MALASLASNSEREKARIASLRSGYSSLSAGLRKHRVRKLVHKLLAVLAAVDGVHTLEAEGLYHPDVLREALR